MAVTFLTDEDKHELEDKIREVNPFSDYIIRFNSETDEPLATCDAATEFDEYCKISNTILSMEQLVGGELTVETETGKKNMIIKESDISDWNAGENGRLFMAADLLSVLSEFTAGDLNLSPGLWMLRTKGEAQSLTFKNEKLKKLDPDYFPEGLTLPEVSAADNDKILQVVDGCWMAVSVQNLAEEGL